MITRARAYIVFYEPVDIQWYINAGYSELKDAIVNLVQRLRARREF